MKKIKLLGLFLVLAFTLIACSKKKVYDEKIHSIDVEKAAAEFTNIDNGGFYINNKGELVNPKDIAGKKVVEWYFEPVCPGCLILETDVKEYVHEIQGENTLIKYYPISFLGKNPDNPEFVTYSDKMTGILVSMAQHDPALVQKFLSAVVNEVYVTLHSKKDSHLPYFEETYTDLGGKNWDKIATDMSKGSLLALKRINELKEDEDMRAKAGGRLATPLLYELGAPAVTYVNTDDVKSIKPVMTELLK